MMRSLGAGVSGMRNEQTKMDVIASNIANSNTLAFKERRVTFQEALVQTLSGATRPFDGRGGMNPVQFGLGMKIGSIDTNFGQGALESTGITTDLAIQGDGYFVVRSGEDRLFTRAGNFSFDSEGRLVQGGTGLVLQGLIANDDGVITQTGQLGDIRVSRDLKAPAVMTSNVAFTGNLNAASAVGDTANFQMSVYDSLGAQHVVSVVFTKTGDNAWDWAATDDAGNSAGSGNASFNTDGTLADFQGDIQFTPTNGADAIAITVDALGESAYSGLTQFASFTTAQGRTMDGNADGTLDSISVDAYGMVFGSFTNGISRAIAQVAIAQFSNQDGLLSVGQNAYHVSVNSGMPVYQQPGVGNNTTISSGALESSNVDLAQQFSEMIVTQRGFQANAKTISTADEMLQEITMLKR